MFLTENNVIELEWLEIEYYATSKTKWDGILFRMDDSRISPGFSSFPDSYYGRERTAPYQKNLQHDNQCNG